ncbi:MAG: prepilin-type N-terminal cleavage/methylation domain-containing protein [bacterium]|nr:prepilin-type N-terminal cleavage/methylation domain-containing protein [bacterium]
MDLEARSLNRRRAFSLIELLIAAAIIGILTAIAVPNYLQAQMRAKVSQTVESMRLLDQAAAMFRVDNNISPDHCDCETQNNWATTPIAYLSSRPIDPFQRKGGLVAQWPAYGFPHYHEFDGDRGYLRVLLGMGYENTPEWSQGAGGGWVFYAIGPDLEWGGKTYSTSNGLYSRGDLHRVSGGGWYTIKQPLVEPVAP